MNRCLKGWIIFFSCLFVYLHGGDGQPVEEKTFSIALTGDSIITRKLSVYQEPEFRKMIELIRQADAAFTNLEILFHDYESYPMHQSGGTYMRTDPSLAAELCWAGFDMVSRANNHAGDYGVLGMHLTTKYVDQAGLVHAGVGDSLAEAREARFLDTAKARLALVSCASSFPDHARAGKTRGGIPPRPGLNPLRHQTTYVVTPPQFEMLKEIGEQLGMKLSEKEEEIKFLSSRFMKGKEPQVRTEPLKEDLEEIAAVVENASRLADYTLVSIHAHESKKERFVPAQFLITFAHAVIEAGADVVVGHGPHVLRGIEIYQGKPIFYSLGNFIFQNETLLRLPYENYQRYKLGPDKHVADFNDARYDLDRKGFPAKEEFWESVIAVPCWMGKKLEEIKLYPITLGYGKPRTVRGRPLFAEGDLRLKIIQRLKRYSQPYGTAVDYQEGIGVIRLSSQ
ncbi:MAG: CapA family protein [Candidatus Aminicenantes bacterium]